MNPAYKPDAATDRMLDTLVSHWLVNERDRNGGRKQRYDVQTARKRS